MKINKKFAVTILISITIIVGVGFFYTKTRSTKAAKEYGTCHDIAPHYVGLTKVQAAHKAALEGREYRVPVEDGEYFNVTQDVQSERLNLWVEKGVVTEANCG